MVWTMASHIKYMAFAVWCYQHSLPSLKLNQPDAVFHKNVIKSSDVSGGILYFRYAFTQEKKKNCRKPCEEDTSMSKSSESFDNSRSPKFQCDSFCLILWKCMIDFFYFSFFSLFFFIIQSQTWKHCWIKWMPSASNWQLPFPTFVSGNNSHDVTPGALCFILRSDRFAVIPVPRRPLLIVLYIWWWLFECYPKQPQVCESRENAECVLVCVWTPMYWFTRGECKLWLLANYPACSLFCG